MNNTLTNGFKIMEYLAGTADAHSVKELAEHFQLPNSHVCRLLKTLTEIGYVEQEKKTRKYKISLKILCLSNACLKRMNIRDRIKPYAVKLAHELNQAVFLSLPHEGHALIIDVIYPENVSKGSGLEIGSVNIAHISATGKVCAAYQEDLDSYLDSLDLFKVTEKTITDKETFRHELEKIRKERIAITDSERGKNVAAVACPLFNCEEQFVAAIGVMLPAGKNSSDQWELYKSKIRETAENASYALGYARYNLV